VSLFGCDTREPLQHIAKPRHLSTCQGHDIRVSLRHQLVPQWGSADENA